MAADPASALLRRVFRDAEESPIRAMLGLTSQPGVISFAGGHPDLSLIPRDWCVETAREVIERLDSADLQYGGTDGLPALRAALSNMLGTRRIQAAASELVITTGSQQGLSLLMSALLEPGDAVAMASYTYPAALQAVRFAGGRFLTLNDDDFVGLEQLARTTAAPLKVVYVVPNFANPTAHCMSREARVHLLETAAKLGVCVIEDDPYGELWFDRPPPDSLCALNQTHGFGATVAYLTSFSKIIAPALRLGALFAPPSLRRAVIVAKQAADLHSGLLEQHVLDAILRSPRLEGHLSALRVAYRAKARAMADALRRTAHGVLSFEEPTGSMFFWAELSDPDLESIDWLAFGRNHRVLALPGSAFSPHATRNARIRLSFANPNIDSIYSGVSRLASGLTIERTKQRSMSAAR